MKITNPFDYIQRIINKIDKNDLVIIITTFIIGIISNLYFIVGEGVAPDAVSPAFFSIAGDWEITLGRFGIKYINSIRYGFVTQLIIILVCLFFIALSIMLLKRIFKLKNTIVIFILTIIVTIAPQFMETYMFIYCADAYLVAFFLAILANYFIYKSNISKKYYIGTILCTIVLCSLYQAYLGVEIGLTIILLLSKLLFENKDIKKVIKDAFSYIIIIFIGVISYYIILKLILLISGLKLASYKGANGLGINTIKQLPRTILQCYKDFYRFFFKDTIIFNRWWKRGRLYIIIIVSLIVGMCSIITNNNKIKEIIKKVVIVALLILIYPISINIMDIIAAGTTINLVTGPGIITSVLFPILYLEKTPNNNVLHNILKWPITICTIILAWTFFLSNTFTYIAREETYTNYKTVASDIYSKATTLENYSNDKKWMFSDIIRFRVRDVERSNGFIAMDNATWNNYQGIYQNRGLFEKSIGIKIEIADKDTYNEIKEKSDFKEMPVYPNPGSIKIIDDVIVIKTSDTTY